jgi:hypothetical protein
MSIILSFLSNIFFKKAGGKKKKIDMKALETLIHKGKRNNINFREKGINVDKD